MSIAVMVVKSLDWFRSPVASWRSNPYGRESGGLQTSNEAGKQR